MQSRMRMIASVPAYLAFCNHHPELSFKASRIENLDYYCEIPDFPTQFVSELIQLQQKIKALSSALPGDSMPVALNEFEYAWLQHSPCWPLYPSYFTQKSGTALYKATLKASEYEEFMAMANQTIFKWERLLFDNPKKSKKKNLVSILTQHFLAKRDITCESEYVVNQHGYQLTLYVERVSPLGKPSNAPTLAAFVKKINHYFQCPLFIECSNKHAYELSLQALTTLFNGVFTEEACLEFLAKFEKYTSSAFPVQFQAVPAVSLRAKIDVEVQANRLLETVKTFISTHSVDQQIGIIYPTSVDPGELMVGKTLHALTLDSLLKSVHGVSHYDAVMHQFLSHMKKYPEWHDRVQILPIATCLHEHGVGRVLPSVIEDSLKNIRLFADQGFLIHTQKREDGLFPMGSVAIKPVYSKLQNAYVQSYLRKLEVAAKAKQAVPPVPSFVAFVDSRMTRIAKSGPAVAAIMGSAFELSDQFSDFSDDTPEQALAKRAEDLLGEILDGDFPATKIQKLCEDHQALLIEKKRFEAKERRQQPICVLDESKKAAKAMLSFFAEKPAVNKESKAAVRDSTTPSLKPV